MKTIQTIATLLICINSSHANIIDKLLNMKSNTDHSKYNSNLRKVNISGASGSMFFYKLKNSPSSSTSTGVTSTTESQPYDPVAIKAALEWQRSKSEADARSLELKGRNMVYGQGGVIEDPHVIEAWREADIAKQRLEKHRQYMKELAKNKLDISNRKKELAGLEPESPKAP